MYIYYQLTNILEIKEIDHSGMQGQKQKNGSLRPESKTISLSRR